MDVWIKPSASNACALIRVIEDFGLKDLPLNEQDVLSGNVIQLGYSPVRIDRLTGVDGLSTDEIWSSRQEGTFGKHSIC